MAIHLKKSAFTVAEVIIVLGIIAVAASLTIPSLINNLYEKQYREAAKEAYSKIYQAVSQIKQENGGTLSYYTKVGRTFYKDFKKQFKVVEDCGLSSCVPNIAPYKYKTLSSALSLASIAANLFWTVDGQFVTSDGMFFAIGDTTNTGWFGITVDVNGYRKGPNKLGIDTFVFEVVNDNLLPEGAPGTRFAFFDCNRNGKHNDFVNYDYNGVACAYYLMKGIDY